MNYGDLPVLITLLATTYLVTVYGLLKLAELLLKNTPPSSTSDVGKANN